MIVLILVLKLKVYKLLLLSNNLPLCQHFNLNLKQLNQSKGILNNFIKQDQHLKQQTIDHKVFWLGFKLWNNKDLVILIKRNNVEKSVKKKEVKNNLHLKLNQVNTLQMKELQINKKVLWIVQIFKESTLESKINKLLLQQLQLKTKMIFKI